jgi:hypothetical protein
MFATSHPWQNECLTISRLETAMVMADTNEGAVLVGERLILALAIQLSTPLLPRAPCSIERESQFPI